MMITAQFRQKVVKIFKICYSPLISLKVHWPGKFVYVIFIIPFWHLSIQQARQLSN